MTSKEFYDKVKLYHNFPREGVDFIDISPVLADADSYSQLVQQTIHTADVILPYESTSPIVVVGVESRGFLLASTVADFLVTPLVLCRKKGKLPGEVESQAYEKEYGTDELAIQKGLIPQNADVIIVDDILATGGTLEAVVSIVKRFNPANIAVITLAEVKNLKGREVLSNLGVTYKVIYPQE